ncbi:MAG: hypothetical protein NTY33_01345, partial [Candidatus Moranbacteria bacterium]|nr:hypothetical protein [Candidatus Moranbacteria bacterium]
SANALLLNGKKVGTNTGDIVALDASGQIDISSLPTGTGTNQLVLGNDKRLKTLTVSGASFISISGQSLSIKKINLASDIQGTLATTYGGLGLTSYTAGDMLYYDSGSAMTNLPIGTEGYMLIVKDGVPAWSGTAPATSHSLLSGQHPDTTPATVQRGDLITGQGATTTWSRLALGTSGQFLRSDGTDSAWYTLTKTDINLGSVENTALSTWAGTTNITTLGTITTGIWNGTTVAIGNGGTGLTTTPSIGQLLIGNGTGYALSTLTQGTGITVSNGAGTITIANAGVTNLTGTTDQINATAATGSITLSLPQSIAVTSTPTFATISTGQGQYELYAMDQNVRTTDGPTFNNLTLSTLTQGTGITVSNGAGVVTITNAGVTNLSGTTNQINATAATGIITLSLPQSIAVTSTPTFASISTGQGQYELYAMDQNVRTTDSPTFSSLTLTNQLTTANGGTGLNSYTTGDILYYASGTTLSKLAKGSDGQILVLSSGAPSWASAVTAVAHPLLSISHSDTNPGTVQRGDLITGQGTTLLTGERSPVKPASSKLTRLTLAR